MGGGNGLNSSRRKMSPFAEFLRWIKILILEIIHIFLRLKFLSALNVNKIDYFSTETNIDAISLAGKN